MVLVWLRVFVALLSNAYLLILCRICLAKKSPVLSVACNPETNTIVAGTELVSSQAVVAFW